MVAITEAVLVAVAKAVATKVGSALAGSAFEGMKKRVLGDPEQKAFRRALARAYESTEASHGQVLGAYDVNPSFLQFEAASELAKLLIPGRRAEALKLAEACVESLAPGLDEDTRWDRIVQLRPVFRKFISALQEEIGQERALDVITTRADDARVATAIDRLTAQAGAVPATDTDESEYLHWLVDHFRYLRTVGMVRNTTVQLPLHDVFVTLSGERDNRPGSRAEDWLKQEQKRLESLLQTGDMDDLAYEAALDRLTAQLGFETRSRPHDEAAAVLVTEAVRNSTHLLMLGDPGCGKTTFLRYLALVNATALIEPEAGTAVRRQLGEVRFPIILRIGDFARSERRAEGIGAFLVEHVKAQECRTPGLDDLLHGKLEAGNCLVLLDGLDEVASAQDRRAVVEAIANFVTTHSRPGNRFVVTSRIAGYRAAPLPSIFEGLRVREMDEPTIERFLSVYCPAIERAEAPEKSADLVDRDARSAASDLMEALRSNAGVRRLAANPLLLTTLLLVHRARGRLPNRRVDAYVEVTEALGRTWRSVQGVPEAELPDDRMLTAWLTRLGAWMHSNRPEGSASKREVLEVLGPLWAKQAGTEWRPDIIDAASPLDSTAGRGVEDFIDKTERHTGLLVERAPGRYGFPHLTFEEYYAGRALAFEGLAVDRPKEIRRWIHNPRYDEPILLGLGLVGREQPEEVERLVAQSVFGATEIPSSHEELLGRDFLFALRILADDIPLATVTVDRLLLQALNEWFDRSGRTRFSQYRMALRERLSALGATRAAARLALALDGMAVRQAATSPGPLL